METKLDYFSRFLRVSPLSLALWRCGEAAALNQMISHWEDPVLDLGCGFGEFMGVYFNGTIEIGVDICNLDLIQAAQSKKYRRCELVDARHLPYKNDSIQTIVSISVLEHITSAETVFAEVFRVLRPGGTFVFSVPTSLINQHLAGSVIGNAYTQTLHKVFKHHNIWTLERWLKLAKDTHFQDIQWKPTLTTKELHLFEYGLPFALPSQITRGFMGKRWVVDFPSRRSFLTDLLHDTLTENPTLPLNVIVMGVKP